MESARLHVSSKYKRKFWLSLALVFVGGLACGIFIGIAGFKYCVVRRHPQPVDHIASDISRRIQREYKLDEETRQRVEQEMLRLGSAIHKSVDDAHGEIASSIEVSVGKIELLLPDKESQVHWRKGFHQFIKSPQQTPPHASP